MHELSVCLSLLDEVGRIARASAARAVRLVAVRIGPLSGVEPDLLMRAFGVARCGTLAETATLVVDIGRVRVRCAECGTESEAVPNRLLCSHCGGFRTRVIEGDELVLSAVEMDIADGGHTSAAELHADAAERRSDGSARGENRHV
ncbi:MAG: hydrogenase maturation nickel metallochaperone HypA [Xanthobacteraceae bacterium]|nr:hydrogenase maturation nickel metallochaperone HypA [Xanthobacteraceae bacterium]